MAENIEQKDKKDLSDTALVPKVPFNKLLPRDFRLVSGSSEVRAEQQQVFQDRIYTYGQALQRSEDMIPKDPNERRSQRRALVEMVGARVNLPMIGQFDPLEEYRKEKGLVERREYLMGELLKTLSYDAGFARFVSAAKEVTGRQYTNMEGVNEDFPHLTKTEIILLSLIGEVPYRYLFIGRPTQYKPKSEEEIHSHLVPVMAGASIDGLLFMDEATDPNHIYSADAYAQLGIVGADESVETAPYSSKVKAIINELIPLMVTNYRLHERIWNNSDNALLDGMSQLDRIALNKVLGRLPNKTLGQLTSELSQEQRQQFQIEQQKLDRSIARDVLIDLQTGVPLTPSDIVKLFGLVHQMPPQIFDEEQPFRGFFTAFGPGILIMDNLGKPMFYTPYHPYYLRESIRGLHVEQTNAQLDNATMAILFNQLSKHAEGIVIDEVEKTGETPSLLEGEKVDGKLKFNIDLDIGPRAEIVTADLEASFDSEGKKMSFRPVIKFGVEEAKQVFDTLGLLPRQMLEGIKRIRKVTKLDISITDLLDGGDKLGEFDPLDHSITLFQPATYAYVDFTPELRALRSFTTIHEAAHNLWFQLSAEERESWEKFSWNQESDPIEPAINFLTMYSHVANAAEDFCDHFASFVLHGPEFRTKAAEVNSLKSKYEFIKGVFRKFANQEIDYSVISPWTIEQLTGVIDAQLNKMSEDQAVELREQAVRRQEVLAGQAKSKVSTSLDQGTFEDVVKIEEEEGEEPVSTTEGLDEILSKQDELKFKSNRISTLIDYLGEDLSERQAINLARRVYNLVEEGELEEAIKLAKGSNLDPDDWKELEDELKDISQKLQTGGYSE